MLFNFAQILFHLFIKFFPKNDRLKILHSMVALYQFCFTILLPSLCCKTGSSVFQDSIDMISMRDIKGKEVDSKLFDAIACVIIKENFVIHCLYLIVQSTLLQVNRQGREADNQEREKARIMVGSKSPRNGPNVEQRNYCNKVCLFCLFIYVFIYYYLLFFLVKYIIFSALRFVRVFSLRYLIFSALSFVRVSLKPVRSIPFCHLFWCRGISQLSCCIFTPPLGKVVFMGRG